MDEQPLTLEQARAVLDAQAFSRLLGTRLAAFGDGRATLELDVHDGLLQQDGLVHGGVLSYLADNALTFAAGSAVGPDVLTVEMAVSYVAGARGGRLEARAEAVHVGRTRVTVRCDVLDHADAGPRRCALAQGTIARRQP